MKVVLPSLFIAVRDRSLKRGVSLETKRTDLHERLSVRRGASIYKNSKLIH